MRIEGTTGLPVQRRSAAESASRPFSDARPDAAPYLAVLLAVNLVTGTRLTGFAAGTWAALLGLGLVTHVGGWLAINYALGHLRASVVSVSLLGQAVVMALVAIPLLGEGPDMGQLAGGVLVLGGIHIVNRRGANQRRGREV